MLIIALNSFLFLLPSCKPTYNKETLKESVKMLAQKEYGLDVEVARAGRTLGVRYQVPNMLGEMLAEDQQVWKQVDDLMLILSRVSLSADEAPEFFVLEVVDAANPQTRIIFTRYVTDIKKIFAEALSRTQYLDRLLIEFVVGEKRFSFDPMEMDLVRLMMMSIEANIEDESKTAPPFVLKDVQFPEFLANVAANHARRILREKKEMSNEYLLRQVSATYNTDKSEPGQFKILLDLAMNPRGNFTPGFLEIKLMPFVAKEVATIFKSYKFDAFNIITITELNSGKSLTVPRK